MLPQQVFGPITQPYYTVRLPRSEGALKADSLYASGNAVYFLPTHQSTAFVSPDMIRSLRLASKPTDASNMFDEELPEDEQVRAQQLTLCISP